MYGSVGRRVLKGRSFRGRSNHSRKLYSLSICRIQQRWAWSASDRSWLDITHVKPKYKISIRDRCHLNLSPSKEKFRKEKISLTTQSFMCLSLPCAGGKVHSIRHWHPPRTTILHCYPHISSPPPLKFLAPPPHRNPYRIHPSH